MKRTVLMIMLSLWLSVSASAQSDATPLPAVGGETLQWVLRPVPVTTQPTETDKQTPTNSPYQVLIHDPARDEMHVWRQITKVNGDIQPTSLAAIDQRLFAVFGDSRVYSIDLIVAPPKSAFPDVAKMRVQLNLPVGGKVLSSMVNEDGYHLILEPKLTVERLKSATDTPQDTRLLMSLRNGKWTQQPLPQVVWDLKQLQLISISKDNAIGFVGIANDKLVHVTPKQDTWATQVLDLQVRDGMQLQWLNLQGHNVVALNAKTIESRLIHLHLIVDEQIVELGLFESTAPKMSPWPLLAMSDKIALIEQDQQQKDTAKQLSLQTLDLQGNQSEKPLQLTIANPNDVTNQPGRLVVSLALMVAVMLMFSVWRRDPANARVTVPDGYQISAMSRRFLALMIDLAPCGLISSWCFGITVEQLVDQWPGVAVSWEQLVPGMVTIALYTTHTTVTEIFTAQTLGKKIMGLTVCTMAGQSPDVWQIILRNLLKILDLIAWYVLPMLVVVSAYRQRLGDVVARTVVIQPKPSDSDETSS